MSNITQRLLVLGGMTSDRNTVLKLGATAFPYV